MKQLLLSSILAFTTLLAIGQANNYPNGSLVSNFTVTDTEGNSHSLYSITAQGKYVMLDFFFDTCPPCQATQTYFNQLHETYGCNDGGLFVMSINNGTDNNAAVIAYENTFGGIYAHAPAVGIEGGCAAVDAAFGVNAYPTYCLIGPNNLMVNQDIWPVSDMSTFVAAFPPGSGITPAACVVGVSEVPVAGITSVYPSPTTGLVTVSFESPSPMQTSIEVVDMVGRSALTIDLGTVNGSGTRPIDLGSLGNGNYIVQLISSGVVSSRHQVVVAN